jgi:SAM-dependent methyltransferase
MTADPDEQRVATGYDAVYEALPGSPTFARIWRAHAMGADFPDGFEHISFVTLAELRHIRDALALRRGDALADVACGMGGPGLWIARETGSRITGIDLSAAGVRAAAARAAPVGVPDARYAQGSFAATGLPNASMDGAMSCDALQYAPDKSAAFREFARVLRPGGRLVFLAFEFEPQRVAGLPIFGADPVADYAPLLRDAGFTIDRYDETPGWRDRVEAAYGGLAAASDALHEEMGAGAAALLGEVVLTLQLNPYRRRVFVAARLAPNA